MKDKRFWLGFSISLVWLAFSAYMLATSKHPDTLNTWGDFFAGFFAPLAFLWLVIGYLQQGEELRHSTEALRLQAEELRNSVQQQSDLVSVSREQVKQEFEALQEERERRRDAARPKFVPSSNGSVSNGSVVAHKLRIVNLGNSATRVKLAIEPATKGRSTLWEGGVVPKDEVLDLALEIEPGIAHMSKFTYLDADGVPGEVEFSIEASGGQLLLGQCRRVL